VRIPGHTGRILESCLHDFYDHGIQALSRWLSLRIFWLLIASLVWLLKCTKYSSCSSNNSWMTPDESNQFLFCRHEVEDYCRWMVVDYACDFPSMLSIIIGCTTSAPDGSSPRGYSRNFSGIGSKYTYCRLNFSAAIFLARLCLDALLDLLVIGAPDSMRRCVVLFYTLLCDLCILLFYPYNFTCVFFLSFIWCRCLIFCSGQNVKAHRFIWTCNLLRPLKGYL
jgi:hypothetical protein